MAYRPRFSSIKLLFWGVFLLGSTLPFVTARAEYEAYRNRFLVGKEVEVPPEHLVRLLPYFDLSSLGAPTDLSALSEYQAIQLAKKLVRFTFRAQLRADCPPEVRSILGSMNWSEDGGALEFRDEKPFKDLRLFSAHTEKFLKLVGMWEIETDPMAHLGKTRFHMHISNPKGGDRQKLAERMNTLALMKFFEGGKGELALTDDFGFSWDVRERGLVRLVDSDRIEIRNHFTSPEKDAAELMRLMSLPEAEALAEVSREIQKRMTPESLRATFRHRPFDLLQILHAVNADLPQSTGDWRLGSPLVETLLLAEVSGWSKLSDGVDVLEEIQETNWRDDLTRKLSRAFREKLRAVLISNPGGAFRDLGSDLRKSYGHALRELASDLSPEERSQFYSNHRLLEPILEVLAEPYNVSQGTLQDAVRSALSIASEVAAVRDPLLKLLGNRRYSDFVLNQMDARALESEPIRNKVAELVSVMTTPRYVEFLKLVDGLPENDHLPVARVLMPILDRGLKENVPQARALLSRSLSLGSLPANPAVVNCVETLYRLMTVPVKPARANEGRRRAVVRP